MNQGPAIFMQRALDLAIKGQGKVHPNPCVGAVVVKNNKIVGEGYHAYFGGPHAEVVALRKAGKKAEGATLYVTLEPCSHWGKTPPCAPAVVNSGINTVYVALKDPNPMVKGKGLQILSKSKIKVHLGLLHNKAKDIMRPYLTLRAQKRPYVILKLAMTLDGKIATARGESKWITGPQSRRFVHKLRSQSNAIAIGQATFIQDNPSLTSHGRGRNPIPVILDPHLKSAKHPNIFSNRSIPPVIFVSSKIGNSRGKKLVKKGIQILRTPLKNASLNLKYILNVLFKMNVNQLLVEGGGETAWNFLKNKLVDELYLFIAPKILGGRNAIPSVGGSGFSLNKALKLSDYKIVRLGPDILIHGYL